MVALLDGLIDTLLGMFCQKLQDADEVSHAGRRTVPRLQGAAELAESFGQVPVAIDGGMI